MTNFRLKVRRSNQTCFFDLSWGRNQQLSATVDYPELLVATYQEWQRIYLSYYKASLRGRVEKSGSLEAMPTDWHAKLVYTEYLLVRRFNDWLRSTELDEICSQIKNEYIELKVENSNFQPTTETQPLVNIFLSCTPIELVRLPWEAWEIGAKFAISGSIRILRYPERIEKEIVSSPRTRQGKARVLAILGDERGLNFQADKDALRSLSGVASVELISWQPEQKRTEFTAKICEMLADERGWDMLLFEGHSNESDLTGGELAIAPGVSISIKEIERHLEVARSRGLQFAIFNSCSGINIAESLINLGLSQVLVMREQIHNRVAQEFLAQFLQVLAQHKDVYEAMLSACQRFRLKKDSPDPSADLIPSLFCYPDLPFFRIPKSGIGEIFKQISPTRKEAIALSALLLLSWQLPVQNFLIEQRVLVQAMYRKATNQIPTAATPPVLLVQIDEKSIQEAKMSNPNPMDRNYLASLVDRLSALNAKVVGIDYLLDRSQGKSDGKLAQSLQAAVERQTQGTWFVFAKARNDNGDWMGVLPEIASSNWSLAGHIHQHHWFMELAPLKKPSSKGLPFAYTLALARKMNIQGQNTASVQVNPQIQSQTDFFSQVISYINAKGQDYRNLFSPAARLGSITAFSYQRGQMWLHPIIDFSIPPDRVYDRLPAWQLLKADFPIKEKLRTSLQQQVAIVAAGGYDAAGISANGQDNNPLPAAVRYWLESSSTNKHRVFTGGEGHAYMVHHYLTQRLVVPIPDIWAIAVVAILGRGTALVLTSHRRRWVIALSLITAAYGLVSLQIYISAALLLPWLLPSIAFWTFILRALSRKKPYA